MGKIINVEVIDFYAKFPVFPLKTYSFHRSFMILYIYFALNTAAFLCSSWKGCKG